MVALVGIFFRSMIRKVVREMKPFLRWTTFQNCCAVLIQRLFEYIVNIKFKTFYAVNVENKFRSHNFILMSRYINDICGSQISMTVSEQSIVIEVSVRK